MGFCSFRNARFDRRVYRGALKVSFVPDLFPGRFSGRGDPRTSPAVYKNY